MVSNRIIRECVVLLAMWRQRWAALGTGSLTEGQAKGLNYLFPIQKSGTVSQAMSRAESKTGKMAKILGPGTVSHSLPTFYWHLLPGDSETSDLGSHPLKVEPESNNPFIHLISLVRRCSRS